MLKVRPVEATHSATNRGVFRRKVFESILEVSVMILRFVQGGCLYSVRIPNPEA